MYYFHTRNSQNYVSSWYISKAIKKSISYTNDKIYDRYRHVIYATDLFIKNNTCVYWMTIDNAIFLVNKFKIRNRYEVLSELGFSDEFIPFKILE